MIIVTGCVHVRLEHLDEVLELSLEHVLRSRAEPGCLLHTVPASGAFIEALTPLVDGSQPLEVFEATPARV